MSKHGAYQDLLDGSFHCANLIQIKFGDRARVLRSSEGCVNEVALLLHSWAGERAFSAQFAGGGVSREVRTEEN